MVSRDGIEPPTTPPEYLFIDDSLSCLSNYRRNAQLFFQELVHMDLKENDDQILTLFLKVYAQEREPVFQKRILGRPELKELFNGNKYGDPETRNRIIFEAFKLYAYTQSEIAIHLELDRTTISKIVNKTN